MTSYQQRLHNWSRILPIYGKGIKDWAVLVVACKDIIGMYLLRK